MTALHEAIESETTAIGFEATDREFTPHATIARMDHAGDNSTVQERIKTTDPDVGRVSVDRVALIESILNDSGPEYRTLETVRL